MYSIHHLGKFTTGPSNFVKIVFDQITSQVLWKTSRVLKECEQGCHFCKVTVKLYQNYPTHKDNFMETLSNFARIYFHSNRL
jgi:hypothetical protein